MEVTINTTITFEHLLESKSRVVHCLGGTRSGKTFAILQFLIVKGLESKQTITVVRKNIPSLKRTVIKDMTDILKGLGIWDENNWNVSDRTYKLGDSTIQFINTDESDKLRGVKSDLLFIDESTEVSEDSYFQLSI